MQSKFGLEIERKFLIAHDGWRAKAGRCLHIIDHLIARFDTGKARIRHCDDTWTLTFKGHRTGFARTEYHVPLEEAKALAMVREFCATPALEKLRFEVPVGSLEWQVDRHVGPLAGLVTADVELPDEECEIEMPDWAGPEITHDQRFSSGTLATAVQTGGETIEKLLQTASALR